MDLGRYQKGGTVVLGVEVVDGGGASTPPDAAPVAVVMDPSNHPAAVVTMFFTGHPWGFQYRLFLDVDYVTLGRYSVSYSYTYGEGAHQGSGSDTFDLIAGGDEGGAVVSMFGIDRPEARYVVAQLESGRLVQGRNPQL